MKEQNLTPSGTVTFKESERMLFGVQNYDGNELMAAITGFDLDVSFNMRLINNIGDAENCANALADIFYQALMEKLIANKENLINTDTTKEAIH